MDSIKNTRLQELDRSDFEIPKGEPDIRGWDVKAYSGEKIGEVEELIIDVSRKKVRYMVVDLDDNALKLRERKVLLPIGLAELHKEDDDVVLSGITLEQLEALPDYDRYRLDDETERVVCSTLGRPVGRRDAAAPTGDHMPELGTPDYYANFYMHNHFRDENLYRHRRAEKPHSTNEKRESDYEEGLRLWEQRSEGGVITTEASDRPARSEISDERRHQMIESRRRNYEERRGTKRRKDKSIIQRIKDEGLRDAGR